MKINAKQQHSSSFLLYNSNHAEFVQATLPLKPMSSTAAVVPLGIGAHQLQREYPVWAHGKCFCSLCVSQAAGCQGEGRCSICRRAAGMEKCLVCPCCLQETMMDHALRTISYIADIGNIVVLMARRRMPRSASQDCIETTPGAQEGKKQYKMICHVFESEDVSTWS